MSSKLYSGYINFKWIQCDYNPLSKSLKLTGKLGEIHIHVGSHYINHTQSSVQVKNMSNYLKTRIQQMDQGLTIGFTRELILTGVWNKIVQNGKELTLNIGYSHPVNYTLPDHVIFKTYKEGSDRYIMLLSIDNELVSKVAAQLYALKKPEPYKGTGFNYVSKKIKKKGS